MRWSDRQQAMLGEMGLRLWLPKEPSPGTEPDESLAAPAPTASALPPHATAAEPVAAPRPPAAPPAAAPPAARPIAVRSAANAAPADHLDWPALQAAVQACTACSLCETRRNTVFGVGHQQAHCMIVGEAPGEQEDLQGEPFVGAAGQLLDRMLFALGLTRQAESPARQVFIANTLKCRPPRNRNPAPEELAACQPYLQRQVALVQPRVIIAMGRFAVQSLLGTDEPIGKLRGRVHDWQGVPLVVTYHPAYLLRQPADKARAWDDLCLAAQCLESAGV